jgi:hypothetical protein
MLHYMWVLSGTESLYTTQCNCSIRGWTFQRQIVANKGSFYGQKELWRRQVLWQLSKKLDICGGEKTGNHYSWQNNSLLWTQSPILEKVVSTQRNWRRGHPLYSDQVWNSNVGTTLAPKDAVFLDMTTPLHTSHHTIPNDASYPRRQRPSLLPPWKNQILHNINRLGFVAETCLLWGTSWVFISKKTSFFIVIAVKTSNLTTQAPFAVSFETWCTDKSLKIYRIQLNVLQKHKNKMFHILYVIKYKNA